MNKHAIIIAALCLCILPATQAQAESDHKSSALRISITKLDVGDKTLKLSYELRNDSPEDVWILVGHHLLGEYVLNADVFMAEDNRTLVIRKRLDLKRSSTGPPSFGRYVRLRPGESQTEGIVTNVPVQPASAFERPKRKEQGLEYATRLAIELGYYAGNLPQTAVTMLDGPRGTLAVGAFSFNTWNEKVISRDDEILIPHQPGKFKGEQVVKAVVTDLRIPYIEKRGGSVQQDSSPPQEQPNLNSCSRIEIQYYPSMLEYFFPYAVQQSLLSSDEKQQLQTENTVVLRSAQQIGTIARDVLKKQLIGDFLIGYRGRVDRYRRKFDLICHYDDRPQMSFPVYNDDTLVIGRDRYLCYKGFPSLRIVTPHVQAIGLRVQCAQNLKNLWYRLLFYCRAQATRVGNSSIASKKMYPTPTEWCDAMLRAFYPRVEGFPSPVVSNWNAKTHICPSASEGGNHYAMNPNCEPNSAPDMVLLFETKAGWNQHGGSELLAFDNHDPKGGCVLLNDGTVKFIRTTEELRQLRWK
ncbi:MAG: hypothetical protein ACYTAO_10440 [Planctomycetota bacterium]|jgi:hypothetical protein